MSWLSRFREGPRPPAGAAGKTKAEQARAIFERDG